MTDWRDEARKIRGRFGNLSVIQLEGYLQNALAELDKTDARIAELERQLAQANKAIAYHGDSNATDDHVRWSREAYARHAERVRLIKAEGKP